MDNDLEKNSSSTLDDQAPWEILTSLAAEGDALAINEEYERMGPTEVARALTRVSSEEQIDIMQLLDADLASELMEEMPDEQAADLLEQLHPEAAAQIIDAMESSEAADLLGDMDSSRANEIMDAMEPEAAEDARLLIGYEDDVAGGLMVTEYLAYPEFYTVGQVITDLRDNAERYREYTAQYAYVVSENEVLVGVLVLRDLILAKGSTP